MKQTLATVFGILAATQALANERENGERTTHIARLEITETTGTLSRSTSAFLTMNKRGGIETTSFSLHIDGRDYHLPVIQTVANRCGTTVYKAESKNAALELTDRTLGRCGERIADWQGHVQIAGLDHADVVNQISFHAHPEAAITIMNGASGDEPREGKKAETSSKKGIQVAVCKDVRDVRDAGLEIVIQQARGMEYFADVYEITIAGPIKVMTTPVERKTADQALSYIGSDLRVDLRMSDDPKKVFEGQLLADIEKGKRINEKVLCQFN